MTLQLLSAACFDIRHVNPVLELLVNGHTSDVHHTFLNIASCFYTGQKVIFYIVPTGYFGKIS